MLNNKVAIVTGSCGGIGRAIVKTLVAEGAKVIAADLNQQQVEALQSSYNGEVKGVAVDVTNYADQERMIQSAIDEFGTVDIVINNAGIGSAKPLIDHDPETDFDAVTNVNQRGVYYGIVAAGKTFKRLNKGGVIINTASVYGQMASEMTFIYNVSKAAVDMMTKCAALEFAPLGVRVVAVAPGRVDTPLLRKYEELGLWEHIRKEQMRNDFTQPEEIASVFAFLASDQANCINGTTIAADDGFLSFKYPLLSN
ncbi:SDR family NAD(P)-dependent oxidoreductase [Thalassotalea mangrovi]|uniref:SDR family oxidoreductase n=1 Tax=Thalassotalea mangrovi TaxID=2572245 RepID=A0A4U1B2S2_9GAMM|nr:SDR family oxidoreductase [Thalassotalea mangrovi]TKB43836.1 SDR family oxidoreductase [Thalassotalea mangrovi]